TEPTKPEQAEPAPTVANKSQQSAPAASNTAAALPSAREESPTRAAANRGLGAQGVLFRRSGPQLSVETIGPKQIVLNPDASYQLVLRNSGDTPAREVTVSIDVPAWADVVELSPSTGTAPHPKASDGGAVRWTVNELGAQSEETL